MCFVLLSIFSYIYIFLCWCEIVADKITRGGGWKYKCNTTSIMEKGYMNNGDGSIVVTLKGMVGGIQFNLAR